MSSLKEAEMATQVEELELSSSKTRTQYEAAAAAGTKTETELTVRDAFRYYWKAVAWSVIISMATIMESYDLQIINSFYAYPQFQKKYGEQISPDKYSIPARWQTALSLGATIGLIIGVFANGYFAERYGPRKVMMTSFVFLTAFICITFFAPNVEVLLAGEILCGIPWGFFSAATPAYAAEICPLKLRGYLTTYVNLCWVIGHLIATGVLTGLINNPTEWSYRIPFALQWMWPVPMLIALWFSPESPWWLVRKDRREDAEASLKRLVTAAEEKVSIRDTITMIVHTIQTERDMNIGSSYKECFQGTNLRRTEIAMISWGCQILPGWAIQNYTTYFFTLAGLSPNDSFKLSLGTFSMAFVGTVLSWYWQTRFGRRQIYMAGLIGMLPVMLTVGFLDLAPTSSSSTIRWTQSSLLLIWFFLYGTTIGPIPYAIAAEVGASNLRIKTISLGRNTYYFLSVLNVVVAPYMLNPAEGNLKGKAAFPAGGFTLVLLAWTFWRLPETKHMTPETLDHLFAEKVPARRFVEEAKRFQ